MDVFCWSVKLSLKLLRINLFLTNRAAVIWFFCFFFISFLLIFFYYLLSCCLMLSYIRVFQSVVFQFSYSKFEISLNIRIPRPPIFGGRAKSFLTVVKHAKPPMISGINSVVKRSSFVHAVCKFMVAFTYETCKFHLRCRFGYFV